MTDNNIIAFDPNAKLPKGITKQQAAVDNDDLSQGAMIGFPVLGFRGGKFRVKAKGEEIVVKNKDGDAVTSLRVILVRSNPNISKSYYAKKYEEGSNDEPDCYSIDGVKPDANSPNKQCETCAGCPQNVFGSRITESGKKAKACSDVRRVAVVPAGDVKNEAFGGVMLLRIPPASLKNLAGYANKLKAIGWPYHAVVTKLAFDDQAAYPLLTFTAVEPLDDDSFKVVQELRTDEQTLMVLQTAAADSQATAPAEDDDDVAALKGAKKPSADDEEEEEEVTEKPKKAAAKKAEKKAEPVEEEEEEEAETASGDETDPEMEKALAGLLGS